MASSYFFSHSSLFSTLPHLGAVFLLLQRILPALPICKIYLKFESSGHLHPLQRACENPAFNGLLDPKNSPTPFVEAPSHSNGTSKLFRGLKILTCRLEIGTSKFWRSHGCAHLLLSCLKLRRARKYGPRFFDNPTCDVDTQRIRHCHVYPSHSCPLKSQIQSLRHFCLVRNSTARRRPLNSYLSFF